MNKILAQQFSIRHQLHLLFWRLFEKPRLQQFKNKHQGEDCFIIGNGPSLNKMDLEKLNDYHLFGLNKIYMIFKRVQLDLSYLICVNSLAIEQSKSYFEGADFPIFLSHRKSRGVIKSKKHIYRLFTRGGDNWYFGGIDDVIFEGMTVTNVAIQVAYFMGFKRIFLVGIDHNFVQKGKPHEKQILVGDDPNHFDPNYFKGQQWHLADLEGSEVSYKLADYHFKKSGRQILDATVGGKLQIFEKIDIEEALKIAKTKK